MDTGTLSIPQDKCPQILDMCRVPEEFHLQDDSIYDGTTFTLKYGAPNSTKGNRSVFVLLSKIDISHAFRNLRVDPLDYDPILSV